MCYDDQARPPLPPGETGPAHGEDLVLTAADGTQFMVYLATPEQPAASQVIIFPDVRGLHQFYKELALRFAEVGITALALDYFGRTAGLSGRDDTFEFWPHVQQLKIDTFWQDVKAAQERLRQTGSGNEPQYVVGFCLGGSMTLWTGTNPDFGLTGLIPFYAGLSRAFAGNPTPLEAAHEIKYPVLGLFGGADQGIPEEQVHQLEGELDKAGVQHNIVIYPGAPHSFFDRKATEFAEASSDAWQRVLSFIKGGQLSQ